MADQDMEDRIDDVIREANKRVDSYGWMARQIVLLRDEANGMSIKKALEDAASWFNEMRGATVDTNWVANELRRMSREAG